MHYVQQILLYRICHTVHQSKWLKKKKNFSLHVHEFGTMSVIIVFFFYFSFTYAPLFCRHFVLQHRDIIVDASNIQNIHTQVSAVHSVSDAVSVVIVSEGFTNTNVV